MDAIDYYRDILHFRTGIAILREEQVKALEGLLQSGATAPNDVVEARIAAMQAQIDVDEARLRLLLAGGDQ